MAKTLPTHLFDPQSLITDPVELITYEIDASFERTRPDAAFLPDTVEDISRLLRWAAEQRVPIVARGAGTGVAGGAIAEHGGIVIVSSRMSRLLDLDIQGRTALVEARLGRGRVVMFGFRPQHRAQTHETFKLLFNALYLR